MAGIELEITLADELKRGLNAAIQAGQDMSEPMAAIAGVMMSATQERFDYERDPLGVPWKPSQRAIEDGGKTLYKEGQLRMNVVSRSGRDTAVVGVEDNAANDSRRRPVRDYALIHQQGGTIRPRQGKALSFAGRVLASVTIPQRAYLGFSDDERTETERILTEYLAEAFRK